MPWNWRANEANVVDTTGTTMNRLCQTMAMCD